MISACSAWCGKRWWLSTAKKCLIFLLLDTGVKHRWRHQRKSMIESLVMLVGGQMVRMLTESLHIGTLVCNYVLLKLAAPQRRVIIRTISTTGKRSRSTWKRCSWPFWKNYATSNPSTLKDLVLLGVHMYSKCARDVRWRHKMINFTDPIFCREGFDTDSTSAFHLRLRTPHNPFSCHLPRYSLIFAFQHNGVPSDNKLGGQFSAWCP